jgi:predicted secreted protein
LAAHEVRLRVGESLDQPLEGFGSAGYRWESAIEQDSSVVDVERLPPGGVPSSEDEQPQSYSLQESFRIVGVAEGEAIVTFLLKRPWEETAAPAREEILKVRVIA